MFEKNRNLTFFLPSSRFHLGFLRSPFPYREKKIVFKSQNLIREGHVVVALHVKRRLCYLYITSFIFREVANDFFESTSATGNLSTTVSNWGGYKKKKNTHTLKSSFRQMIDFLYFLLLFLNSLTKNNKYCAGMFWFLKKSKRKGYFFRNMKQGKENYYVRRFFFLTLTDTF